MYGIEIDYLPIPEQTITLLKCKGVQFIEDFNHMSLLQALQIIPSKNKYEVLAGLHEFRQRRSQAWIILKRYADKYPKFFEQVELSKIMWEVGQNHEQDDQFNALLKIVIEQAQTSTKNKITVIAQQCLNEVIEALGLELEDTATGVVEVENTSGAEQWVTQSAITSSKQIEFWVLYFNQPGVSGQVISHFDTPLTAMAYLEKTQGIAPSKWHMRSPTIWVLKNENNGSYFTIEASYAKTLADI